MMLRSALVLALLAGTQAAPGTAPRLTGIFLGTIQVGEYESALVFDERLLSMDRDAIVQVKASRTPAMERALEGLTMIAMVDREPAGARIRKACSAKCKVTGTIVQRAPGEWVFTAVSAVEALPDAHDFAAGSRWMGGPGDAAVREIGVGDRLRVVLLDALRPTVERDLGQKVRFAVTRLRTQGDWAFAVVRAQTPSGGPIDFGRTRHALALRQGMFERDGTIHALLQARGGKWTVRGYAIGATDIAYAGWPDEYGAPDTLLGLPAR